MADVSPSDPVESLVERSAVSVHPDETLSAVAALLAREDIGAVLVRDREGQVVGIVSERDLVRAWADEEIDVAGDRAADVMTFAPESIDPRLPVADAAALMLAGGVRHLPIVDDSGPLGLVSMRDVLAVLLSSR